MANFTVSIPNFPQVLKDFEQYGQDAQGAVYAGLYRTASEVLDQARRDAPKDTTTLTRSITLEERRDRQEIDVFTNVEYAAIIEFGFNGIQEVRQHERTISQAFGRRIPPVSVTVTAHERRVVREAKPYMGPAAEAAQKRIGPNVLAELEALRV